MTFNEAAELQKKISNQFLFSRQNQPVLAGGWDMEPSASELTYQIFDDIFGVSVAGNANAGYHIELLTDQRDLYVTPILDYFNQSKRNIIPVVTDPFQLMHRKRPLEIGCSVSHRLNNIMGTLGCFVKGVKDAQTYILSNHHVLYNDTDRYDNFVIQPCALYGGTTDDAIGLYHRSLAFYRSDINEFDAAIAGPISAEINWGIPNFNTKVTGTSSPIDDLKVYKIGAATGMTFGKITSILTDVRVNIDGEKFDFQNQIRIQGYEEDFRTESIFSSEGDSGSLIIDYEKHMAVGLLFAGNKQGITLANFIDPVLGHLGVEF